MASGAFCLKLIQLNIWQGRILIAVSRFLKEQDADIVCMQEVFSSDVYIPTLEALNSLENLQKNLGYEYLYYEPALSFETAGVAVRTGNAILSKYPLEDCRAVFTNNSFHHVDDWATNKPNTRNLQLAKVVLPEGKSITLANHHGYHEPNDIGSEKTVEAMKIAANELKKTEGPLIFAGDLNVRAESPAMRVFDGWLEDLTASHHVEDTLTVFGKVSGVPCDHILVSEDVQVKKFEVSD